MPLINCPECGKEVSDHARDCPNCGYSISGMNKRKADAIRRKKATWGVVAFAMLFIIIQLWNYIKSDDKNNNTVKASHSVDTAKNELAPIAKEPAKSEQEKFLDLEFMDSKDREIFNYLITENIEGFAEFKNAVVEKALESKYIHIDGSDLYHQYRENEILADSKFRHKEILLKGLVLSIDRNVVDHAVLRLKGDSTMFNVVSADFGASDHAYSSLSRIRKGSIQGMVCKVDGLVLMSVHLEECRLVKDEENKITVSLMGQFPSNRDMINFFVDKKRTKEVIEDGKFDLESDSMLMQFFAKGLRIDKKDCLNKGKVEQCITKKSLNFESNGRAAGKYFEDHGIDIKKLRSEQPDDAI